MKSRPPPKPHDEKPAKDSKGAATEAPSSSRPFWLIVAALTVVGGFLRFWKLGQASLWGDEINFVLHSAMGSLDEYIKHYNAFFAPPDFPPHLPVATLIEFFVTKMGTNEFWGRFSAALFGTLTVPLFFIAGRWLFDKTTGLIATGLAMLSFFLIYYSRDANYYSPLVFFCTAFLAALWSQMAAVLNHRRPRFWGLLCVWLSGTLALQTHLQAVLFVGALGAGSLVIMLRDLSKMRGEALGVRFKQHYLPLVIAFALCWPLAIPWGLRVLKVKASAPVAIPPQRSLDKMWNLPFQMGWGNFQTEMAFASVVFLGCLVAGLVWGLMKSERRRPVLLLLWAMFVVLAGFFVMSSTNGCMPHYVIMILVPVLLLAASGIKQVGERLALLLRRPVVAMVFPAVVVLWLAVFEIKPLRLLYDLRGKPTDWKGIAEWISNGKNLPQGTVVYFDWYINVWQHVPTYYKTPGAVCSYTMPIGNANDIINNNYRPFTRSVFERFPDAAYLEVMRIFDVDPRLDALGGRKWSWPSQGFSRQKSFRNDPLLELYRLGICPIPINTTNGGEVEPILYYNAPDDLLEMARQRGDKIFKRYGNGCGYLKTFAVRNDQLAESWDCRVVTGRATIELFNLTAEPLTVQLQVAGVPLRPTPGGRANQQTLEMELNGQRAGNVSLDLTQLQGKLMSLWGITTLVSVPDAQSQVRASTPITVTLPPGRSELQITASNAPAGQGQLDLLLDDILMTPQTTVENGFNDAPATK